MADTHNIPLPLGGLDEGVALRSILEGTANETGERFFAALVENLAKALKTHGAWVTEYIQECRRLRALAFWMDGQWIQNYEVDIAGTPCEQVIDTANLVHFPDNLLELYPDDPDIKDTGAVSYLGMPLKDTDGRILGHLAVIDRRPIPDEPRVLALFNIFAARATAEMQRLRAEKQVREREEKLRGLFDSAMDAVIEFDEHLKVTRMNPAAQQAFHCDGQRVIGEDFSRLISERSEKKLRNLIQELGVSTTPGRRSLWIPGGLEALPVGGKEFPAEATLSRFQIERQSFYSIILRNINERLEADRKIHSLAAEAAYLREEIKSVYRFDQILGQSQALKRVLEDVEQVAVTDTTVLILGETGTGKELIARGIHGASRRSDKPLITINCAAIPAALMESEFFGHEKGAFTGATQKREGRFELADHGTIFLDEIGELSLDLQAKILRVLQEGEFAPVGSSQTKKVDVRVIAATNRDLNQTVRDGGFREDLYYRLNVFPIEVPPLRERDDDILLLASAFAAKFAQRIGRRIEPLSEECKQRLMGYPWPGNVRELQNVIERAVITSRDGRLNLDRALPDAGGHSIPEKRPAEEITAEISKRILRIRDLQHLERENILRALESTAWRVAGKDGAAALLGMNPSTLNSRIRALRIQRPK
ncbi:MAG TPA: sigma 54-interacting transcriptional regulator [Candidatus Binatia bacterium]|nr:sigma 54-interacting transcriptional regulator [Candidatus Binatia bacterium]